MNEFLFYVAESKPAKAEYPFFLLKPNKWDDYGNRTLFFLEFYDSENTKFEIGEIKIMHKEAPNTRDKIQHSFSELSEDFCSLGQDNEFYKKFVEVIGKKEALLVLENLNDAAFNPGVLDIFQHLDGFKNSLIRFSEAEKALREAKAIIAETTNEKMFNFSYCCRLSEGLEFPSVEFNFTGNPDLPSKIIALVGNNGTGKTSFLAQMALDLSGQDRKFLKDDTFNPGRPLFSRVIAVSYSAFDKFTRPKSNKKFSYFYCGIKGEDGHLLSQPKISDANRMAFETIREEKREGLWLKSLSPFLGDENASQIAEEIFDNGAYDYLRNEDSYRFSSGQKYLLYVLSQVIAYTQDDSLILFDEPETHLHPTAVIKLINTIYNILNKRKSYAVLATHSPIILQAIPSSHVRVFERIGDLPNIRRLYYECFGGNIARITDEVFNTTETEKAYTEVLQTLSTKYIYEDVLSLFENNLTLNPRTYLFNLYNEKSNPSRR